MSPYPPVRDGIGDYTHRLGTAIRELGHDVAVVTPRAHPGSPADVIGSLDGRGGETGRPLSGAADWRPDIVHVQFAVAAFGDQTGRLLRRIRALRHSAGPPVIVTLHEVARETSLLAGVARRLFSWLAANSDHLIVHTNLARAALVGDLGVAPGRVSVIPHPAAFPGVSEVSPGDIRDRHRLGDARVLLAFGFIHPDKGLLDLLHGLRILRGATTAPAGEVRLVVAGAVRRRRGAFRVFEARDRLHLARVLTYLARHRMRGLVTLTGYVPDDEVATWLEVASAVVLPYRRAEQSGVAGMALALGVPVLASTAGGLGEQVAGSPWLFPPRAPRQVADVLARFLSNPSEPPRSPDRCGNALSQAAERTVQLYAGVLREVRGSRQHAVS